MFKYRTHKITSQDNLPELWRTEGKIYRQKREGLHISRKELSKEIGCSSVTIYNFENGKSSMWRSVMKKSYEMALQVITSSRLKLLQP